MNGLLAELEVLCLDVEPQIWDAFHTGPWIFPAYDEDDPNDENWYGLLPTFGGSFD